MFFFFFLMFCIYFSCSHWTKANSECHLVAKLRTASLLFPKLPRVRNRSWVLVAGVSPGIRQMLHTGRSLCSPPSETCLIMLDRLVPGINDKVGKGWFQGSDSWVISFCSWGKMKASWKENPNKKMLMICVLLF